MALVMISCSWDRVVPILGQICPNYIKIDFVKIGLTTEWLLVIL